MNIVSLDESKSKPCEPWPFGSGSDTILPDPKMLSDMLDVLERTRLPGGMTGVALAAPQVGIFSNFFVIKAPKESPRWVFNPVMRVLTQKRVVADEGCLTVPGEKFCVTRFASVSLTFQNERGEITSWSACKGLLGRIVQHEMGHLNGTCIKDFAPPVTINRIQGGGA